MKPLLYLLAITSTPALANSYPVTPAQPVVIRCPVQLHVKLNAQGFEKVPLRAMGGWQNVHGSTGLNNSITCVYGVEGEFSVYSPKPAGGRPIAPCKDVSKLVGNWVEPIYSAADLCPLGSSWCSGGTMNFSGLVLDRGPEVVGNQTRCVYRAGSGQISTNFAKGKFCLSGGNGTEFKHALLCW